MILFVPGVSTNFGPSIAYIMSFFHESYGVPYYHINPDKPRYVSDLQLCTY
jgi:hypothetical protein